MTCVPGNEPSTQIILPMGQIEVALERQPAANRCRSSPAPPLYLFSPTLLRRPPCLPLYRPTIRGLAWGKSRGSDGCGKGNVCAGATILLSTSFSTFSTSLSTSLPLTSAPMLRRLRQRQNDIYVFCVSSSHCVAAEGKYIAFVSTITQVCDER